MFADPDPTPPARPRAVSRRALLRLSLLAAATPAVLSSGAASGAAFGAASGAAFGAASGAGKDDSDAAYQRAFLSAIADDRNVRVYAARGREFLYRPRQVLVARADTKRVSERLRQLEVPARLGEGFAGVDRLVVDDKVDIPGVVARLRDPKQWPGERPPQVQPHHVIVGNDLIMGNPRRPPVIAPPLPSPPAPPQRRGDGEGVLVGVCDTGIWASAGVFHPEWLLDSYVPDVGDEDPLFQYDDLLGLMAGHGTFVAGVLRQAAPAVRFDPEPALDDTGLGDEEMLVRALDQLDPAVSIINLSLGCFTQDDVPPLPIVERLAKLGKGVVVVASAGNSGGERPSWPAALPDVLAVAAVTTALGEPVGASYSNYGAWVDACAEGEWTSTYVVGRWELPGAAPVAFRGFARWDGTSFAAPHVAGRLAAMMSASGYSAEEARQRLLAEGRWHRDYGVLVK